MARIGPVIYLDQASVRAPEDRFLKGAGVVVGSATINRHRKAYYAELQRASQSNQIDDWIDWFARIVLEAQSRTIANIRFLIAKARLLDRLRGKINARQEKAFIHMMAEGPDGFIGGLSAHNYRTITDATPATTTRDLAELVELGALHRTGEHRYARYHLVITTNASANASSRRTGLMALLLPPTIGPGINQRDARCLEVGFITRHYGHAVD